MIEVYNKVIEAKFMSNPFMDSDGEMSMFAHIETEKCHLTSYYSYARPAQPGLNQTRLCGPCIAAIAGD